jgi:nucleotide-binding universal stress UspA family protein
LYKKIAVPVDLSHVEKIEKSLKTAADLSKHYKIPVVYIGITASTPSAVARTPAQYTEKLEEFAAAQSERHGHETAAKACVSHDPAIDLDSTLLAAVKETGADLVVMASHIPDLTDYVWPSHGGSLASHSDASVFVVR